MNCFLAAPGPTQSLPKGAVWTRSQPMVAKVAPSSDDVGDDDFSLAAEDENKTSHPKHLHVHAGSSCGFMLSFSGPKSGERQMHEGDMHRFVKSRHEREGDEEQREEEQERPKRRQSEQTASAAEVEIFGGDANSSSNFSAGAVLMPPICVMQSQETAPAPAPAAPVREDLEAVVPGLGASLEKLLPGHGPHRAEIALLLSRFGSGIVHRMAHAGVQIGLGPGTGYHAGSLALTVREIDLEDRMTVLAALARAFDHTLGGGDFASRSAMAVLATCPPSHSSPEDYFAHALADHLEGRPGVLASYLEYLLEQSRTALPVATGTLAGQA